MINEIKISNRETQKKAGWLRAVVQPVSWLQHWLVSDASDKSRRNCRVACYELTCPGEKFLPDPHQLVVDLYAKAYITIHAHVFISIYTKKHVTKCSDSWYFHLQENHFKERISMSAGGSRSTRPGGEGQPSFTREASFTKST